MSQLKLQVLKGHISQETAYVVDDYPYGFRLRCKIRYWLEFKKKAGFRLVSQTTNPKLSSAEMWNKPKASTYSTLGVMGLDEKGYVTWETCNIYDLNKLEAFDALYNQDFDENQAKLSKIFLNKKT